MTIEGDRPVGENPLILLVFYLEYPDIRRRRGKQAGLAC